jgi:tocopherol cyclase
MKTAYAGTVTIDGQIYDVTPETSFGYADKNWGTDFTNPWIWLASCDFVRRSNGRRLENSALDVGGGRPKVLGLSLGRQVLVGLDVEGVAYDFNFTHLWKGVRAAYRADETADVITWRIRAENRTHGILIDAQCPKDEMLLVRYENPDGEKNHDRLWNGGTGTGRLRLYEKQGRRRVLVEDLDFAHAGCEYGEY